MRFPFVISSNGRIKKLENELIELKKAQARAYENVPVYGKIRYSERTGQLTWSELWEIYEKTSAVRNSVDCLARELSALNWEVAPKRNRNINTRIRKEIAETTEFFQDPNSNRESLAQILKKLTVDLLVYSGAVCEKVKSVGGRKILEIFARDAHTFKIDTDKYGYLQGYRQIISLSDSDPVDFQPDDLIYFNFTPTTHSIYGFPIIESIIDEVAILLNSSAYIASYFTEDSIPPGILNLDRIGDIAYKAAKEEFMANRGRLSKEHIRLTYGTDNVKWVQFNRTHQE